MQNIVSLVLNRRLSSGPTWSRPDQEVFVSAAGRRSKLQLILGQVPEEDGYKAVKTT